MSANHKVRVTLKEVVERARAVAAELHARVPHGVWRVHGVPRGGLVPAALVVAELHARGGMAALTEDSRYADVIVDDVEDSGETRRRYWAAHPFIPFHALWHRTADTPWLVFPWEATPDGEDASATDIPLRLLEYIGEDPTRGGLQETPKRFLAAWEEWTRGYRQEPGELLKVFEDGAEQYDEIVLVKDIPVYSHCEHHLAPFFGKAHVGYIPNGRILGLSKFARVVDVFARRLQVQERLTAQIAHALQDALQPAGVAVVLECRHLCMESRGVRAPGTTTTTSRMLGTFRDDPSARAEFMRLVR